jgi:hypothetical protein
VWRQLEFVTSNVIIGGTFRIDTTKCLQRFSFRVPIGTTDVFQDLTFKDDVSLQQDEKQARSRWLIKHYEMENMVEWLYSSTHFFSILSGKKWSDSLTDDFILGERSLDTLRKGDWVGLRSRSGTEKRKISCPSWVSNSNSLVFQLVVRQQFQPLVLTP